MIHITRNNVVYYLKFKLFYKLIDFYRDELVEKALIHSLFWIEQLIFDFSSAQYAVLRTFCVNAQKEEISMKKFISSGVFVKALVRLANQLFSNCK